MLQLSNGCKCSDLNVFPKDWKSPKASTKKDWYISYRFYDPNQLERCPKGKLIIIKGMNKFKDATYRRDITKGFLDYEIDLLTLRGYNPISNTKVEQAKEENAISAEMPFIDALKAALKNIKSAKTTLDGIKLAIKEIEQVAIELKFTAIPIGCISKKHFKSIFTYLQNNKPTWSPKQQNKNRSHLMMVFKELVDFEAIESDPVKPISKQATVTETRLTLTMEERNKVISHLKQNYPAFYRLMQIFFHSGAREAEMMLLKKEDVDIVNQRFSLIIKKGKHAKPAQRAIKDIALPFWKEIMAEAKTGDYLFSKNLLPGSVAISPVQLTRRWRVHVKDKLGIKADFYSLKHLNLDETAAILSLKDAAKMADHTSTHTTIEHYAFGEKERQLKRLETVNNSFA